MFTGTTGACRSPSPRRNRRITSRVIDISISGFCMIARSIVARVTLTSRESRTATMLAERGSPVNSASSPMVSPRPISLRIFRAPEFLGTAFLLAVLAMLVNLLLGS